MSSARIGTLRCFGSRWRICRTSEACRACLHSARASRSIEVVLTRLSYLTVMCLLGGIAATAHAIDCPPTQNACGTDKCCTVYDICTSAGRGACCPVATPYACTDGTCAVTPTACEADELEPLCPEYQIVCGGVCIEAGSDCCNEAGDYCPPTQTCTEIACVVAGTARPRIRKGDPHTAPGGFLMPTADPPGPQRTCSVTAAMQGSRPPGWVFVCLVSIVWRCRRRGPLPNPRGF